MAQQIDHIEYMSQEIGPRPAGTEEEQQTALYIADTLQNETGFSAVVEDVVSSSNVKSPKAICSIATILACLVALIFQGFLLPALFIALIAGVLYAAESMGYPLLTKTLARGASQNVVAKYEPASQAGSKRSRKIILVAHYDTGKVKPKPVALLDSLPVPWDMVSFVAMLFIPFYLLLKLLFFAAPTGVAAVIINFILIIAMIAAVLPAVRAILYRMAPYSDGANDNAAGVAVMLEVAKNISTGLMNESEIDELEEDAVIHGEEAAFENGLVPEGADLVYHAEETASHQDEPQSAADSLAAAKAAIAALTGTPVSTTTYINENESHAAYDSYDEPQAQSYEDAADYGTPAGDEYDQPYTVPAEESPVYEQQAAPDPVVEDSEPAIALNGDVPRETLAQQATAAAAAVAAAHQVAAPAQSEESNLPDWYIEAQRKAKRTPNKVKHAQRSRYADALDAAVNTSASYFDEANRLVESESEERIRARSADIVEVLPPALEQTRSAANAAHASATSAANNQAADQSPWNVIVSPAAQQSQVDASQQDAEQPAAQRADQTDIVADAPQAPANIDATSEPADAAQAEPAAEAPAVTPGGTTAMAPITFTAEELAAFGASSKAVSSAAQDASSMDSEAPDFVPMGQRAPLADAVDKSGAKNRLSMLPAIDLANPSSAAQDVPSRSGAMRSLRTNLPSFSGSLERIESEDEALAPSVNAVGSFGASGATGSFEPVGEELFEDVDPEDIYIDDADESDFEDNYTESGAYAGPGYVDMPKSRVRRFLSKFHLGKKNEELDESPQEWLEVEDEFDPREVGKERGGWESFRDEEVRSRRDRDYAPEADAYADDYYEGDNMVDPYADDFDDEPEPPARRRRSSRRWEGGALSRVRLGHVDTKSHEGSDGEYAGEQDSEAIEMPEEIKQIYQFRNPAFPTEVWFVALGSELEYHDGMKAFIEEHRSELRGAVFIELEALGAGELALVESEGALVQKRSSSRMKRYLQKVSRATGISFSTIAMPGNESAASTAIAGGMQALHLVGADGNGKALANDGEDVLENIDIDTLEANTYFVEELIKSI